MVCWTGLRMSKVVNTRARLINADREEGSVVVAVECRERLLGGLVGREGKKAARSASRVEVRVASTRCFGG